MYIMNCLQITPTDLKNTNNLQFVFLRSILVVSSTETTVSELWEKQESIVVIILKEENIYLPILENASFLFIFRLRVETVWVCSPARR